MPVRVLAKSTAGVINTSDLALLAQTDYVAGLPVQDWTHPDNKKSSLTSIGEIPTLAKVIGSREDFEYQFPAAPEFFVGRRDILSRVKNIVSRRVERGEVIVLNAQSGWGKSSLALRIAKEVEREGGTAVVFDTRTASSPLYVTAALREVIVAAATSGKLMLPTDASFASLQSTLRTLQSSIWPSNSLLLLFFDQFENVFRDARLTREFRDLALAVRNIEVPLILGFSWKTDLVALAETYPYELRDEIRSISTLIRVEPFGPKDVDILLGRLAKAAGTKLSFDLKQRIREYSQGLPWLLKKLASHILNQLRAGTTEETLLSQSLNIQGLFQQDVGILEPTVAEALRIIAREAPVLVSDIVERVNGDIVQSLVNQRLVVQVGERIDVYWDIFREFLLTGKVAVEDTYILRQRPQSTAALLQYLIAIGREVTANDAASGIDTSVNVVFNSARDLRQLGILVPKSGSLLLAEQFRTIPPTEDMLRERVAKALRQHTVYGRAQKLLANSASVELSLDKLTTELPSMFPAMEAATHTWRIYAQAFALWFDYAGLMSMRGQVLCAPTVSSRICLLDMQTRGRRTKTFPQGRPELALKYLLSKMDGSRFDGTTSAAEKAQNDWECLSILDDTGKVIDQVVANSLLGGGNKQQILHELMKNIPGAIDAFNLLSTNQNAHPSDVGKILKEAYGLPWARTTTNTAGAKFRKWASHAGIDVSKAHRLLKKGRKERIGYRVGFELQDKY